MMKTWTSGKSQRPTSYPSAKIKFVSQWWSVVSVADLCRNSTLRSNNSQSWCYWLYWSVVMTMVAVSVSGDVACLTRCGMLRASLDTTGHCLGGWHGHQCCLWTNGLQNTNFSPPLPEKTNCCFFAMEQKKSDWDDINKECSIFNVKIPLLILNWVCLTTY